jgi:hypothetical protein
VSRWIVELIVGLAIAALSGIAGAVGAGWVARRRR